jgi:hypothetical protein
MNDKIIRDRLAGCEHGERMGVAVSYLFYRSNKKIVIEDFLPVGFEAPTWDDVLQFVRPFLVIEEVIRGGSDSWGWWRDSIFWFGQSSPEPEVEYVPGGHLHDEKEVCTARCPGRPPDRYLFPVPVKKVFAGTSAGEYTPLETRWEREPLAEVRRTNRLVLQIHSRRWAEIIRISKVEVVDTSTGGVLAVSVDNDFGENFAASNIPTEAWDRWYNSRKKRARLRELRREFRKRFPRRVAKRRALGEYQNQLGAADAALEQAREETTRANEEGLRQFVEKWRPLVDEVVIS